VLVVLVAASLILLTAYFGESTDGRLHSVQRTTLSVLSPIQDGASRVLKPFRDLFGWFGDTIDAKDQRDKAVKERDALQGQLAVAMNRMREAEQKAGLNRIDTERSLEQYGPVDARVVIRSPNSWYQTWRIDKGTDDGVHRGDPVVNGAGLVGKVEAVTGSSAVVTLITDGEFGTGAIAGGSRVPGSVVAAVGAPGDLTFEPIDASDVVRKGELIYTAGTTADRLQSRYPAAIPVGRVDKVDIGEGALDKRIHVKPAADLKRTDLVQVLTEPHADQADVP
jgi:rod shape-determining protein MreC